MSAEATATIIVQGKTVDTFNDADWRRVRERAGVTDDFLAATDALHPFKPGGGKGGDLMAFSRCGRYIVKEVKGDHKTLMEKALEITEHLLRGNSLMAAIYAHFQEDDKFYLVMNNLLTDQGPWLGLYDLKGCADDKTLISQGKKVRVVNKRIWHLHMWGGSCCWTDDRHVYFKGKQAARHLKIILTDEQRLEVMARLKGDCEFLTSANLMDYSLLVAVRTVSESKLPEEEAAQWSLRAPANELRFPLVHRNNGQVYLVYIGIIDYLQIWNNAKKVAQCLKFLERNKATIPPLEYGRRFVDHFDAAIEGLGEPLELSLSEATRTETPEDPISSSCTDTSNLSEHHPQLVRFFSCQSTLSAEAQEYKSPLATPRRYSKKKETKSQTDGWSTSCWGGIASCFSGFSKVNVGRS